MNFAFKEWALVCEALGSGRQSLILRKGGIAEGRDGFAFLHPEFFLFPTRFHETLEKTTLPPGTHLPVQTEGAVEIRFAAKIEWSSFISDSEQSVEIDLSPSFLPEYPLRNPSFFAQVAINGLTVKWPNVIDYCSDALREWCESRLQPS